MLFINNVKLRNFKSFKYANIPFNKGFVCLAGPNGSGKSNIVDSLRFIFGESSLKALRAKKTSELINVGSKAAEITISMGGEKKYEIRRAIRDDGTTIYRLNGKRTTRTNLMDMMRKHGIHGSDHNVIAQGQVQRIVEMSQKERRQIIDTVAGISEFEDKKKESLKELEKVEQKISDSRIVLKEREGFLTELSKERDDALKFIDLRDRGKQYKASIIHGEVDRLEKDYERTVKKYSELKGKEEEIKKATKELEGQIEGLEKQKHEIVKKINEKSEREKSGLLQEAEELKSVIAISRSSADDKKKEVERLSNKLAELASEKDGLEKQRKEFEGSLKALKEEAKSLDATIKELSKKKSTALAKAEELNKHFLGIRKKTAGLNSLIEDRKDELRSIEIELDKLSNQKLFMEEQLEDSFSGDGSAADSRAEELETDISSLKEELRAIDKQSDKIFDDEKMLNKRLPEIEKDYLEAKDKYVALATSMKGFSSSPEQRAVEAVLELRDRGMVKGIEGTVGELCEYDEHHASAIEASAGGRLSFVVVEDADVAQKAIEYLKNRKIGRCTFIPLDKKPFIYSPTAKSLAKSNDSEGFLIDAVQFKPKHAPAFQYVFGDTLLVGGISAGKRIGLGKIRMVTYDGDLMEASGVMTGGSFKRRSGGVSDKAKLEQLRKKVDSLKEEKDQVMSTLHNLREELNNKRRERTGLEVKLKGLEIELSHLNESEKARADAEKQKQVKLKELERKLAENKKQFDEKTGLKSGVERELSKLRSELSELSKQLDYEKESREKESMGAAEKELLGLNQNRSDVDSRIASVTAEQKVCEQRVSSNAREHKEIAKAVKDIESEIKALLREADKKEKLREKHLAKLKNVGGELETLYTQRNDLESQIEELAKKKGSSSHGFEKYLKELSELEIRKATVETRLSDLKAEYESYKGVEVLDLPKRELEEELKAVEAGLAAIGEVNLKAPELYEQRVRDIKDVKEKIELLAEEKSAVVAMIEEIETKKKAIFMETFKELNEQFKTLYSYIFKGEEATLSLENPSEPFDSGLQIKARKAGKERYLEAMSGGEKTLLALLFVFAIQMCKPAPFYILDEADAALDKENSKKLSELLVQLSKTTQFIVVTHNDTVLSCSDIALGVTMTDKGSKVVGVELKGRKAAEGVLEEGPEIVQTQVSAEEAERGPK